MKTIQPIYENIKEILKEDKQLFIGIGKNKARVQGCYKNKKGSTFVVSSMGEHKVDLFSMLYIE